MLNTFNLGKPVSPDSNEFPENFRKGGGAFSDLKNFIAIFLHLKQLFLSWISRKTSKKGGGSFPIWKISLQIWCWCYQNFSHEFLQISQYPFPKKGGGGSQRPFGVSPEIHPFWWIQASLSQTNVYLVAKHLDLYSTLVQRKLVLEACLFYFWKVFPVPVEAKKSFAKCKLGHFAPNHVIIINFKKPSALV